MSWKPVPEYEGIYEVSDSGAIRSLNREYWDGTMIQFFPAVYMSPSINPFGYCRVSLSKDGFRKTYSLHRLVALAHIPNPKNLPQVNHLDGNKSNNKASNLQWCTASENMAHALATGLIKKGESQPRSKLTAVQVTEIRGSVGSLRPKEIAIKHGISLSTVYKVINRKSWTHV